MDGCWRGVGGDDGDDLHSGRVPEQRSWTPNLGFVMAAELRKVSGKSVRGSSFLGHEGAYKRRGPRGKVPGAGAPPCRGLGPTRGWDPPLLLGWPPFGVFCLRGLFFFKNPFYNIFGIFRELLNPVQKKDTKCNSGENNVSSG